MMTAHTTPGTRHQAAPRLLQPIKFPVHKSGFGPRPTPGELLLLLLLLTALLKLTNIWSKALRIDANQQIATTAYSVCHDPHCKEGSETPVATLVTSWLPSICEGCAALIGASIGGGAARWTAAADNRRENYGRNLESLETMYWPAQASVQSASENNQMRCSSGLGPGTQQGKQVVIIYRQICIFGRIQTPPTKVDPNPNCLKTTANCHYSLSLS